jgi:hypothetical protein
VVREVVGGGGEVPAQEMPRKATRHGFNRRVNMPAAVVDGVRRQASLQAHVRGELVNQLCASATRHGRSLEPPQEAKPISRDLHEPLAAEACGTDTTTSSLMPHPTVGGRPDLLGSYRPCAVNIQALRDEQ